MILIKEVFLHHNKMNHLFHYLNKDIIPDKFKYLRNFKYDIIFVNIFEFIEFILLQLISKCSK